MVQYDTEKLTYKTVYYTGSDTLQEGYLLCYDYDRGTAANVDQLRAVHVEKPATANLKYFAGVVAGSSGGVTGPAYIKIIQPTGAKCNVHTNLNCTLGTTELAVTNGQYYAAVASSANLNIGIALQTVDRSDTVGTVYAQLDGIGGVTEIDTAAVVTATQVATTKPSGSTTGGTALLATALMVKPSGSTTGATTQLATALLTKASGSTTGATATFQAAALTKATGATTGGTVSLLVPQTGGTTGGTTKAFATVQVVTGGTSTGASFAKLLDGNFRKAANDLERIRNQLTNLRNDDAKIAAQTANLRNDLARVVAQNINTRGDFARVVKELNAVRTDVAAILTSLKNANIMATA